MTKMTKHKATTTQILIKLRIVYLIFVCIRMFLTVMILCFRTDRSGQTVHTLIRLEEQSDQGLQCLLFHMHLKETFEPLHEKTNILHMRKKKTQISFAVSAKLISAFVFATRIVRPFFFLNPKFQASSHFLWLYSLVCVGPDRKPECWFSHDVAYVSAVRSIC